MGVLLGRFGYKDPLEEVKSRTLVYQQTTQGARSSTNRSHFEIKADAKSPARRGIWKDATKVGPYTSNPETPTYKYRLSHGLCTRCGMNGHMSASCPTYPTIAPDGSMVSGRVHFDKWGRIKEGYEKTNTTINAMRNLCIEDTDDAMDADSIDEHQLYLSSVYSSPLTRPTKPQFFVQFTIHSLHGRRTIHGKALLDSGPSHTFISTQFTKKNHIPTIAMIKPILVHQADGIHTLAFTMRIQGHNEKMQLPLFNTNKYDLILGLDWLTYHNPTIDWETQSLTFDGYICKHPIVPHQIPNMIGTTDPKVMVATPQMSPDDQSRISKDWPKSEFPQVFDMELHSELSHYRAGYDFDPQFKKDVPLPKN
ncbi:hypothetical protein SeLEV6574_g08551, partial [Synchytrium endobioticum]